MESDVKFDTESSTDMETNFNYDTLEQDTQQTRKIEILDIKTLEKKTSEENQYELQGVMRQLYDFYFVQGNSRDVCYHISCKDPVLINDYLYSNKDAYERFGLYLNDGVLHDKLSRLEIVPEEIFQNNDVSKLHNYMVEKRKEAYDKGFDSVEFIIEAPLDVQRSVIGSNARMLDSYVELFNTFTFVNLDSSLLVRKDIARYLKMSPVHRKKTLVNMLSLFVKHQCLSHGISAKDSVSRQYAVIKECEQIYKQNPNVLFYCDISEAEYLSGLAKTIVLSLNRVEEFMYTGIAAYLTLQGIPCYVDNIYSSRFARAICEFMNPKTMYLADRITFLKNPLRMGVMNALDNGNFKSIAQLQGVEELNFQLRFISLRLSEKTKLKEAKRILEAKEGIKKEDDETPLALMEDNAKEDKKKDDDNPLEIVGDTVKEIKFDHRNVKIRDVRDFYDLHTMEYETALGEMEKLNKLLVNAREILDVKDRSLDCSNTLFFEYEGELKLGYLTQLNYKVKYKLTPLAKGYKVRNIVTFDENDLHSLVDIRAYDDYIAICGKALEQDPDLLKINLPDTIIGFLIKDAHRSAENITSETGLPFDTIALHSEVASSWRGNNIETLLECGLPIGGLQRNFLTFFGGPVPYHGTNLLETKAKLVIGPELWRRKDCDENNNEGVQIEHSEQHTGDK